MPILIFFFNIFSYICIDYWFNNSTDHWYTKLKFGAQQMLHCVLHPVESYTKQISMLNINGDNSQVIFQ